MNRSISCCTSLQGPMVQNYGKRSCQGFQSLLNGNKIDARAVSHLPAGVKAVVNQTSLVPRASQLSKRLYSATRIAASGGDGGGSSGNGGGGDGGDDKGGSGGNWFGAIWSFYLMQLERNPLVTKAITSGLLNGVGDAIAQLSFSDEDFNWKRFAIFQLLGFVLIGPALHVWYGTLARMFSTPGTSSALGRLAMDQILFAPFFLGSIISSIMVLEGHASEVPAKLKGDLFTIVRSNWVLWVPFQFINFRFVPQHLQVLASNCVALGWNTYMSWASHSKASPALDKDAQKKQK